MSKDASTELAIMRPGFNEVLQTSCEEKREEERSAARWQLKKSYKEESRELFRRYTGLGDDKFDALRKIDPERLCDLLTRKALGRSIMKLPLLTTFLVAELATLFVPSIFVFIADKPPSMMMTVSIVMYVITQALWFVLWLLFNLAINEEDLHHLHTLARDALYLIDRLCLSRSEAVKVLEDS